MAKQYEMNPFDAINMAFHGTIQSIINSVADAGIKKVIFNEPVTVVYWGDGVKTVVHCQDGDRYDPRTGLLLCCAKRLFGNRGRYNDILNKATGTHDAEGDTVWSALFGTPERAAQTLVDKEIACTSGSVATACFGVRECRVCPIAKFCGQETDGSEDYDRVLADLNKPYEDDAFSIEVE